MVHTCETCGEHRDYVYGTCNVMMTRVYIKYEYSWKNSSRHYINCAMLVKERGPLWPNESINYKENAFPEIAKVSSSQQYLSKNWL